jgi:hypothetical protein
MGYAAHMRFAPEELALLAEAEEIEIETAQPGGPPHRTIIWIVADGDDVFIRSVNGAEARWYREAIADPAVTIHVGDRALPARVEVATDADSVQRTNEELTRKYTNIPGLSPMLKPDTFDCTLRVVPA